MVVRAAKIKFQVGSDLESQIRSKGLDLIESGLSRKKTIEHATYIQFGNQIDILVRNQTGRSIVDFERQIEPGVRFMWVP